LSPSLRGAKRRSNPHYLRRGNPDCFASLAMTKGESLGRHNRAFHLAETDAVAVALAPAAHHERIAVLQERALDAAVEPDRLGAVPTDLQEATALMLLGTRDGAAPQEIADVHRAAARGMVHQLLHRRPVHVFE